MQIGKYKLIIIESGYFRLDGGAMFGIIPKPLWSKTNPADESNRIKLSTRNLLLVSDSKKILIDTGMGNKWDDKSKNIYQIEQQSDLILSLEENRISPADITDVFLTHLHFDHTGGSTKFENGKLVPSFPNAKYFVQKKNFEWGMNPGDRDRGSYIQDNFFPLMEAGMLNLLDEKEKFFDDELEIITVNGHTYKQQLLKISDSTNTIFYCGDLFPTSSHIPYAYIMGYDLQPLITLQEKQAILPKACEENWFLFYEHDPFFAISKIRATAKGFERFEPKENFG